MKIIYVNDVPVDVSDVVYRAYWQETEHARYLAKRDDEHVYLACDLAARNVPEEALQGGGVASAEEVFLQSLAHHQLAAALASIGDEAAWLVPLLLGETTERALAVQWGISPSAVHGRKVRLMRRLRKLIDYEQMFV